MLYDIGFLIFSVVYLPVLIFKGKLHREFPERFGRYALDKARTLLSGRDRIWIQAVSVGEVAVCKRLIPLLKEKFPGYDLVLSTITKAGNDLAKKLFSKDAAIIYFPLDFRFAVRRAIKHIKPKVYIMIETEIWPNLLSELSLNSVSSVMINGRISDRSIGKYRLAKPLLKNALSKIRAFCMQDTIDAERVIELGAPPDRVKVTGNMKFDVGIPSELKPSSDIRKFFGLKEDDELLVAGSTHDGEEDLLAEAFKNLAPVFPKLKLLIAPRHVERVKEVENIIKRAGLESTRVSKLNEQRLPDEARRAKAGTTNDPSAGSGSSRGSTGSPSPEPSRAKSREAMSRDDERRIIILDSIGHLNEAYSVATLVFVGGSLVKHGGQNPIEPAVLGRAMLFGPHMFNFRYIAKALLKEGAAVQITCKEELVKDLKMLLKDPLKRSELGENAKRAIAENRGATKKNLEKISEILRCPSARPAFGGTCSGHGERAEP